MCSPHPHGDREIEAENGKLIELPNSRDVYRVQFHRAEIIGEVRNRCQKAAAIVVGLAVNGQQISAQPPVPAEFELVASTGEPCPVAPRVPEKSSLQCCQAPRVIVHLVVESESEVEFVVQMAIASSLPVRARTSQTIAAADSRRAASVRYRTKDSGRAA